MAELIKEFRGIPRRVAEANIRALADARVAGGAFVGDDWRITLENLTPVTLGSLTLGRIRFVLRGNDAAVERVWEELAPSFLRGGG